MLSREKIFVSTALIIAFLLVSAGLTFGEEFFKRQELQVEGRVCGRIMEDTAKLLTRAFASSRRAFGLKWEL